jgi:predicted  nucleic acid-binding Zn-ribbon protein
MRTRHRIPAIFNLSMVDVLCCALGCVIFLWLVNFREATRRARAVGETGVQLASTREALTASKSTEQQVQLLLENTRTERDRAQQLALANRQELDRAQASLQKAQSDLAALHKSLKSLRAGNRALASEIDKKNKVLGGLEERLGAADARAAELDKQLRDKAKLLITTGQQAENLADQLNASGEKVAKLEEQVSALRAGDRAARTKLAAADAETLASRDDLTKLKKELAEIQGLYRQLQSSNTELEKQVLLRSKEVTENRLSIADLERTRRALEDRIRIARQAADNRFAGVELTGKRVVFLVDMSGSMDLMDENTPAPDKWPLLCETLARVMKSLPELTHFQVILFSDRVTYALGNKRRWLVYDRADSAKNVEATLRKVKAQGGTNMAAAFAEAFEFRAQGMDTIYIFSDGLPNMGEGLPALSEKLSESQKTAYCTKYLRHMLKNVWNHRTAGQPAVHIHAIGFFFESPDVGAFLWALAREHEGSFVGMSKP